VSQKTTETYRILLVDDEEKIRQLLAQFLGLDGHTVATADSAESARRLLESQEFDLVVTDLRMEGLGGLGLLAWLQEEGPAVPAIVISAYGDVADAVEAMHRGALDYLVKPFEPQELALRAERAVFTFRLERSLRLRQRLAGSRAAGEPGAAESPSSPVGRGLLESANPAMRALLDMARKAAPSTASILISGESGTGKEVLASWIHSLSERAGAPFVPVNLGGLPENLLETELFGHEKGAFTGADRRKTGMFELANGGTLFLDEIGDMPLHLQVKLLRALQDRRIQRLGSTVALPVDLRIIAASHRDLPAMVKEGRFREDLLYRLNVIPLHLPPLRQRPEDLPALISHILARHQRPGVAAGISSDALEALGGYAFPGNVRELENMLERALILCDGPVLRARDFGLQAPSLPRPEPARPAAAPGPAGDEAPPAGSALAEVERWAILRELGRQGGRRQATAEALGISRRTLLNKLNEYGLREED
jgi:two-component system response regulator AtoC